MGGLDRFRKRIAGWLFQRKLDTWLGDLKQKAKVYAEENEKQHPLNQEKACAIVKKNPELMKQWFGTGALEFESWARNLEQNNQDRDSYNLLHLSAHWDFPAFAKQLLESGMDVNAVNHDREETALEMAVEAGAFDTAHVLLDHGADVTHKSGHCHAPTALNVLCLENAGQEGASELADRLCAAGAPLEIKDEEKGRTPLYCAVHSGATDMIKVLIDHGADVNTTAFMGWTPLQRAVMDGTDDCVRMLLKASADPGRKDEEDF